MSIDSIRKSTDESNYRFINPVLSSGFVGLPSVYCKLSFALFNKLTNNLFRGSRGYQKGVYEKNRIFTDIPITIYDVLDSFYCGKYEDGALYVKGKNKENDVKNMHRNIEWLHDNNIFLFWRFRGSYMFYMQRDITCWKFYNSEGVILPKTLLKIIRGYEHQINRMSFFYEARSKKTIDREHLEKSYIEFIQGVISKMGKEVAALFPKMTPYDTFYDYMKKIQEYTTTLAKDAGFENAKNMFLMLPEDARKKGGYITKENEQTMSNKKTEMEKESNLSEELNPTKVNLCNNKGMRKQTEKKAKTLELKIDSGEKLEVHKFDGEVIKPFESPKSFVKYYKAYMSLYAKKDIKFENEAMSSEYAGHILDDLRDMNKTGNQTFLNSWLDYFLDKLTENKMQNRQYTSLMALRKSLNDFSKIFWAS